MMVTYGAGSLVNLVAGSILGSRGSGSERRIRVLGDVLVGFLGGARCQLVGLVSDV